MANRKLQAAALVFGMALIVCGCGSIGGFTLMDILNNGNNENPAEMNPATPNAGGYTLSGTYTRSDGTQITITENGQIITITGDKPNNGGRINETLRR